MKRSSSKQGVTQCTKFIAYPYINLYMHNKDPLYNLKTKENEKCKEKKIRNKETSNEIFILEKTWALIIEIRKFFFPHSKIEKQFLNQTFFFIL